VVFYVINVQNFIEYGIIYLVRYYYKFVMEEENMSIEKQRLYNEIETLPETLTIQVINFIEYLKLSYIDAEAPDSVTIKSKKDLKEKLQAGLDDIEANRVYSLAEAFAKIDNI